MTKRLNIEAVLRKIVEYAEHSDEMRPLLIRTDSHVTSDILRDATEKLVDNSKKVTIGNNAIIDDGLNIVYFCDTARLDESVKLLKGKKYIIIVEYGFEPDDEILERFTFIDCVNDKALTVAGLAAELEKLPEDLFIFAKIDSGYGLTPIQVNLVTKNCICYTRALRSKLVRVGQMLDEIRPIKDSNRSITFYNCFPFGIDIDEVYTPADDYITIDMELKDKCVERLVNKFKYANS